MTSTTYSRYYESDDDSAEWNSDPAPRRKRRNTRTSKYTPPLILFPFHPFLFILFLNMMIII